MHLYKKNRKLPHGGLVMSILLFGCLAGYFIYGFSDVSGSLDRQQKDALQKVIQEAMVSCYAIEGCYPPSLSYLEEHYGIVVDYNKFIVDYQTPGSNVKPGVQIFLIGGEGE